MLPTIGGLGAYFYSNSQDTVYQATASILVQQRGSGFSVGQSDFAASQRLASIYRRQLTAEPFLERLAAKEAVPFSTAALRPMVSAHSSQNPPVLDIKVRHRTPEVTAFIAQAAAEEFIDYAIEQRLAEIARVQSAAAAQGIVNVENLVAAQLTALDSLSLLESVVPPGSPVLPRTRQNVILGVILGLLLAAGGALALESFGDTVRSPDEISRRFGVTSLGAIFKWSPKEVAEGAVVLLTHEKSGYAEAFRQIRANIEFATANRDGNIYMVSSPGPSEGKSTIVSNLACTSSKQVGQKGSL